LKALQAQAGWPETCSAAWSARNRTRVHPPRRRPAKSERDVLLANVARAEAVIARKRSRPRFRARIRPVGRDVGQYLNEGTAITTLQGIDDAVRVDFSVTQDVAATLKEGDRVLVSQSGSDLTVEAAIVASDSRVDSLTRNTMIRARIEGRGCAGPRAGTAVRVRVPVGPPRKTVVVPANALRKGPMGDHVFVIGPDEKGAQRAHQRMVVSGALLGDEVVIEEGLKVGEQIAASGSFKLREAHW
jgi:membrane fusion protein (multidrug efflux system)